MGFPRRLAIQPELRSSSLSYCCRSGSPQFRGFLPLRRPQKSSMRCGSGKLSSMETRTFSTPLRWMESVRTRFLYMSPLSHTHISFLARQRSGYYKVSLSILLSCISQLLIICIQLPFALPALDAWRHSPHPPRRCFIKREHTTTYPRLQPPYLRSNWPLLRWMLLVSPLATSCILALTTRHRAFAALTFPALFDAIIFVDPVIVMPGRYKSTDDKYANALVRGAISRRDEWASRCISLSSIPLRAGLTNHTLTGRKRSTPSNQAPFSKYGTPQLSARTVTGASTTLQERRALQS